jgi:CheY-like chemotaxis protein
VKLIASSDALRLVERGNPGPIDLILTDVIMPGMSGDQFIERLPAQYRGVPVLYMSGYAGHRRLDQSSFIQKPFSPHALCIRIRSCLQLLKEARAPARGGA